MPLTPFHMGPGLLLKAVMHGAFSLILFGIAQILIDLQPLIALSTGRGDVHGFSHTWLGAVAIGAVAAAGGRPLANAALRWARGPRRPRIQISWPVAIGSAYIGTLSHIALDGFMHADLRPFSPWSDAQPWLGDLTVNQVYLTCVLAGALGAVLYVAIASWRRRRGAHGGQPT